MDFLILLAGFVILIVSADKLVDAASALASRLGVPSIVIGLTIVAFGTSAPELVVNVIAALNNNTEMVLGNVLGSNIFNVLAILGLCSSIYPLAVKTNTTWLEIPLSLLAAVAVLIMANDVWLDNALANSISRSEGLMLLLFFFIFLVYNLKIAKGSPVEEQTKTYNYTYLKAILLMVLGIMGLILGGRFIVTSAVGIAQAFGLTERIIGLTVVSIGTSLPELATSIVAVRKRNVDIAIGNVVGSNIFNIFLILGISTVINPLPVRTNTFTDIAVNLGAGMLLFLFIIIGRGRQLARWEGVILFSMYIAYLILLINQE